MVTLDFEVFCDSGKFLVIFIQIAPILYEPIQVPMVNGARDGHQNGKIPGVPERFDVI